MAYRENLLVNYLRENPVWTDYIDIFEEAWGNDADELALQLADSRNLFPIADDSASKVDLGVMLNPEDFRLFDRQTMVRVCSMLGFGFPNLNDRLFSTEDYMRIAQNIAAYYREQGTDAFIKFFSYCLNSRFNLRTTWTKLYTDTASFLIEGDSRIGTPVWQGGEWYPTSHVQFEVEIGSGTMNPDQVRDFFYYIAPINLVLLATLFTARIKGQLFMMMGGRLRIHQLAQSPAVDLNTMNVTMAGKLRVHQLTKPTTI